MRCLDRVSRDSGKTEYWVWSLVAPSPPPGCGGPCQGLITSHTVISYCLSSTPSSFHLFPVFPLFSLCSTSSSCRHTGSEHFLKEGEVHVPTTDWYMEPDNPWAKCYAASWHEADILLTSFSLGTGRQMETMGTLHACDDHLLLRMCGLQKQLW